MIHHREALANASAMPISGLYCAACIANASLPLIQTLRIPSAEGGGFAQFPAIYMLSTAKRWDRLREQVTSNLAQRRIGPLVRVVNGSALDEMHREQMEKTHIPGRRHHVAVTWAHIHIAEFALSRSEYGVLVIEDDAQFNVNASMYVGHMLANLTANGWQRPSNALKEHSRAKNSLRVM